MATTTFPWFNDLYLNLLRIDLDAQLPGIPIKGEKEVELPDDSVRRLLGAASAFSLSNEHTCRALAYEVVSRLVETHGDKIKEVISCADIVLSRVGNFPGRLFLRNNYAAVAGSVPQAPAMLALERLAREVENTVPVSGGRSIPLTDFQFELFKALDERKSFSVSAPTSAGKSYVLSLDLIRRLERGSESIVYLVPTRALIREVSTSIRLSLREANLTNVPVRTVPFGLSKEDAPTGVVYVLTQERLMTLLSVGSTAWITTLIVDEAHNIQDGTRGVVLQSAIERVAKRFPSAEIHFASPLSKNPQMLLELIGRTTLDSSMIEELSPVSQNIILVSQVNRKPNLAKFALLTNESEIPLGIRELTFDMRGNSFEQKANFARSITAADEATIIFSNDPHTAEKIAQELCNTSTNLESTSYAIEELIDYIKKEVHPQYHLIQCLLKGVAYHYGDMPALVRARVEDLFKSGDIKFICCTSTLLQGVNLPARHIIIENPKRGKSGPMPRRDFLNLAGRAGRLLKEFHGNVWCIRPDCWEEQVFRGERLITISSAVDNAMHDGGSVVKQAFDGAGNEKNRELGDAVLSKLFLDYVSLNGSLDLQKWESQSNSAALLQTGKIIQNIKVTLPMSVFEANPGLQPDRLQTLYEFMLDVDYGNLLPINPWAPGYYERMENTIQLLERVFRDKDDGSYRFFAWLASKWIHNAPLSEIIASSLEGETESDKVSTKIRSLLKTLETEIRFRLVKYYAAYSSLLEYLLESREEKGAPIHIEPFHVYLECGASDASTLNLIALGVSRSTALAAGRTMRLPSSYSPEECLAHISRVNIDLLDMPDLCKRELKELTGANEAPRLLAR